MEQNEKSGKLLEVKDLRVSFFTPAGEVKAVSGISTYPYRLIIPAIIISIMILSFNLFGDGLRDALDPRLKK